MKQIKKHQTRLDRRGRAPRASAGSAALSDRMGAIEIWAHSVDDDCRELRELVRQFQDLRNKMPDLDEVNNRLDELSGAWEQLQQFRALIAHARKLL